MSVEAIMFIALLVQGLICYWLGYREGRKR